MRVLHQGSSSGSIVGDVGVVYTVVGDATQGIYLTEQFALGITDLVREEEGWVLSYVNRLPRAK